MKHIISLKSVVRVLTFLFFVIFIGGPFNATKATSSHLKNFPELFKILGEEAYSYLDLEKELSPREAQYLEFVALKVSLLETLAQQGVHTASWDPIFVSQNNLLNILRIIIDPAKEAFDVTEIINNAGSSYDLKHLAEDELVVLNENIYAEIQRLQEILWDLAVPHISGDIVIEIFPPENRPESSLAVGTMAKFYENLALNNGWGFTLASAKVDDKYSGVLIEGGTRLDHAFIKISGSDVFRKLFLESGVHRFIYTNEQLIGSPLKGDSTHTNYAQVRVYATPKESAFVFKQSEVETQFIRSSGAGGQHINKTSSAVRATHKSGLSVFVQQERSQHHNKKIAMDMLKAMLFTQYLEQQQQALSQVRTDAGKNILDKESPFVRTYNLLREPVPTRAILTGQAKLDSFNRWEYLLEDRLGPMIMDLVAEIHELYAKFPSLQQEISLSERLNQRKELDSKTSHTCSDFLSKF